MKDPQFPIISHHFWTVFSRRHCRAGGGGPLLSGSSSPPCIVEQGSVATRATQNRPDDTSPNITVCCIAVTDISA